MRPPFKPLIVVLFIFCTNLNPLFVLATELPANIVSSVGMSQEWLNSLKQKSLLEVKQLLGEPLREGTWEFKGAMYPLLEYDLKKKHTKLSLYFFKNSVVNISLLIQSE